MPTHCLTCEMLPSDKELAVATWYQLGMLGCEETPGEHGVRVRVHFADARSRETAAQDLLRYRLVSPVETSRVDDEDWNAQWRAAMKPARIAPGIWVAPTWLRPPLCGNDAWIRIEPKMAFGTGHHESTRLAAAALASSTQRLTGARVLDVGTGSGVLCLTAAVLGASTCLGIDIDPVCAANLAENRRDNPDCAGVRFAIGTLDAVRTGPLFDVAVMNMIRTEAEPCLAAVAGLLCTGGVLVWSGLLAEDRGAALSAAARHGLASVSESAEDEWICCVLRR